MNHPRPPNLGITCMYMCICAVFCRRRRRPAGAATEADTCLAYAWRVSVSLIIHCVETAAAAASSLSCRPAPMSPMSPRLRQPFRWQHTHPDHTHTHTHTDRTPTHAYRTHGAPSPDVCQSACFCTHECAHVPGQPLNAHTRAPSPRGREQEIVSVRPCKLKVNGSSEIIWLTRAGAYYAIARFCHTQDLRSMELGSEIALSAPYPMHRLSASFSLTRDYLFLHFLPASC